MQSARSSPHITHDGTKDRVFNQACSLLLEHMVCTSGIIFNLCLIAGVPVFCCIVMYDERYRYRYSFPGVKTGGSTICDRTILLESLSVDVATSCNRVLPHCGSNMLST